MRLDAIDMGFAKTRRDRLDAATAMGWRLSALFDEELQAASTTYAELESPDRMDVLHGAHAWALRRCAEVGVEQ